MRQSVLTTVLGTLTMGALAVNSCSVLANRPLHRSIKYRSSYSADDADAVARAASDGIGVIDASTKANIDVAVAAFNVLLAVIAESQKDIANLLAELQASREKVTALRDAINALRNTAEELNELRAELDELKAELEILEVCQAMSRTIVGQFAKMISAVNTKIQEADAKNQPTDSLKRELLKLQETRDALLREVEANCAKVLAQVKKLQDEVTKTAKVRRVLTTISRDRTKAAELTDLIRRNNRTGIAEFLKREGGGGDFVISDAKIATGPLVIFRVDALSHCLSAGGQCSGKLYSFSN